MLKIQWFFTLLLSLLNVDIVDDDSLKQTNRSRFVDVAIKRKMIHSQWFLCCALCVCLFLCASIARNKSITHGFEIEWNRSSFVAASAAASFLVLGIFSAGFSVCSLWVFDFLHFSVAHLMFDKSIFHIHRHAKHHWHHTVFDCSLILSLFDDFICYFFFLFVRSALQSHRRPFVRCSYNENNKVSHVSSLSLPVRCNVVVDKPSTVFAKVNDKEQQHKERTRKANGMAKKKAHVTRDPLSRQ